MSDDTPMSRTTFTLADTVRGEDGELYHLPTLRALHARGLLRPGTPAHLALLAALAGDTRARLIA